MKLKIYSLAADGPKCGTHGAAFATEREAYAGLLYQLGLSDDDAASALLEAGDFDALEDLLHDSLDGLTTWTLDCQELTFPDADAPPACTALLACLAALRVMVEQARLAGWSSTEDALPRQAAYAQACAALAATTAPTRHEAEQFTLGGVV